MPEPEPEYIDVVVGATNWQIGGVHHKAIKAIPHKEYNDASYAYDIALIKLETPISYNKKVQPIKYSERVVPIGQTLRVSGKHSFFFFFFRIYDWYIK